MPVSSGVVMVRTRRCCRPWLVIWFISFFCRGLDPSHQTPSLTSAWLSSHTNTASCPAVTDMSCSFVTIRTRSVERVGARYSWPFRDGFQYIFISLSENGLFFFSFCISCNVLQLDKYINKAGIIWYNPLTPHNHLSSGPFAPCDTAVLSSILQMYFLDLQRVCGAFLL